MNIYICRNNFCNRVMKSSLKLLALTVFVVFAATSTSCYKKPRHGIARIIVIDGITKLRVPNATVHLHQKDVDETLTTDYNGLALYDQADYTTLEEVPVDQVLNCDVSKGSKIGSGIVKIKPGETITEVIPIY